MEYKIANNSSIGGNTFEPSKNSGQRIGLARVNSINLYNGLTITSIDVTATAYDLKQRDIINIGGQELSLSADEAAGSTTLAVSSTVLSFDIELNDLVDIDYKNLFVQYQRKSAGTIAGMSVSADTLGPIYNSGDNFFITGVDPTYVKILPRDFLVNDDASAPNITPAIFNDGTNTGVSVENTDQELIATVNIPYGTTATDVAIWGSNTTKPVEVYEMNIDANGTGSTIGTGTTNGIAIDITDTAATTTNYLMVKILVSNVNHRIWGGKVTLTQN